MSRNYSEEEKRNYLDKYKVSGQNKTTYGKRSTKECCFYISIYIAFFGNM